MAKRRRNAFRKYAIVVRPKAEEDLVAIWAYIARDAAVNADRFLNRLVMAIEDLRRFPEACPVARESKAFGFVIRQRLVGRYRVLFTVHGNKVRVLRVRSTSQEFLSPNDDPLKG